MKTILVVDDESALVESLTDVLGWNGYTAFAARNGREALDRLATLKPDLLLVDFMMPVMNGVQMLAAVRGDAAHRALPAILMTASPPPWAEPGADRTLWDAVLTKPFDLDELLATIERLTSLPPAPRSE